MRTYNITKGGKYSSDRYNDMCFVVAAINKKDVRTHLHNILVRDGIAYGTDGHRLHCSNMKQLGCEIEDGIYSFIKTAKEVVLQEVSDATFPNIDAVFPMGDNVTFKVSGNYFIERVLPAVGVNSDFKFTLDISYLQDLETGGCNTWNVSLFSDTVPVMFQNCTKTAIIMPVRIK